MAAQCATLNSVQLTCNGQPLWALLIQQRSPRQPPERCVLVPVSQHNLCTDLHTVHDTSVEHHYRQLHAGLH